jgi:hypothetical protein
MPPCLLSRLTRARSARRYVALSKVENVLKGCTLVEVPMVYADSTR